MELWLGFHIGFVGRLNTRKKLVMDGKAVAWYYITRGQFLVDTLTAIAWIAQVRSERSVPMCRGVHDPVSSLQGKSCQCLIKAVRMSALVRVLHGWDCSIYKT